MDKPSYVVPVPPIQKMPPLSWTYAWTNDAGVDITIDPTINALTLDYAGQGITGGESVTCTATVTDGETEVSEF